MNLIFMRSNGEERIVATDVTEENVITKIKEFITEINPEFEIHYIREWQTKRGIKYDVGSHIEFFLLEEGNPVEEM